MKKRDMLINAANNAAFIFLALNLPEEGHLKFVDIRPIAETQIAKVLEGNTDDCLTVASQTKPVPMSQALNLEGKTVREVLKELPSYFCEGKREGVDFIKYATDSGKQLYIQIDKSLDEPIRYAFDPPKAVTPTAKTEAGRSAPNRSVPVPRKAGSENNPLEKR